MTETNILSQLEIKLKRKLKETTIDSNNNGYVLNESNHIVALNLNGIKINNLSRITSILFALKQLTRLSLANTQLTDITPLKELKKLCVLELAENRITDITPLKELILLTKLSLNGNYLSDIDSLKNLRQLRQLDLSSNQITDITPLKDLLLLTELNLNNNKISSIDNLKGLKQLLSLELWKNKITSIDSLKELENIRSLQLSDNLFSDISPLKNLKNIKQLYIHNIKLKDISVLKELENIEGLYCVGNEISDISPLMSLQFLTDLYIGNNKIKNIYPLQNLRSLKRLYIPYNFIKDITPLKEHKNLSFIDLRNNPIEHLPEWIANLNLEIEWTPNSHNDGDRAGFIYLYNDIIKEPPVEIIRQGRKAIQRYFLKIRTEGVDYIYEAKLTFVGEGSAGKTSLKRRLLNERAALPKKDKRTRGIEIVDWQFKKEKGKNHIAHIWDFGGQDVYYPVHRFFITENSVFVLLASTRQTHHNFDYWIPTIYQFGGKSPIILGQTCHDGNKVSWNDLGVYVGNPNFNIIKTGILPYCEINLLNKNEGLANIKQSIISQITNLPHYGKGVPKSWVPARNLISEESKNESCISFERFKELCKNSDAESFINLTDINDFCQFLHDIGVVIWYSQNDDLKNWVVLQPEWAMNAVYKIIDDEEIQRRRGNILIEDFNRLWKDTCYEGKYNILKKMLEIFKIAFPKKHKQGEYIIPARLYSIPTEKKWIEKENCLRLEYRYEFMPRGMVNQISAELSRYITCENEVWNNAVNFRSENNATQCQVYEDFYNRKIIIKAKGKDARGIIILVMDSLKNITEGYKGVKPEIFVPCTCSNCKNNNRPTTFLYDKLMEWSTNRENAKVICNESGESLIIEELLYNVGLQNPQINKEKKMNNKTVTIFLASSSELKVDREQFEIFINRENKQLNEVGVFLKLELWEDFIDAMSKTRLQDEYNKVVKYCDIFVSLFFTKVGKYTAEEFEIAFGQFSISGKPLICTYFKDEQVQISKVNQEEINSKYKFEEKLKSLGHYPTSYKSIDDLKYQFKMQLEKILRNIKQSI